MEETEERSQIEENLQVLDNLARIKHKIVVMSGKGGVGKSTVAVNLALTLASEGYRVGVMDVDIHGPDVAMLLGVEDERLQSTGDMIVPVRVNENLSAISMAFLLEDRDTPIVWRGPMKMSAIKQFLGEVAWGDLDYLVIDLPPGTGDEPLSVAQMIPDGAWAVVVTTPQDLALLDSRKAIRFAEALNMNVAGVVENMAGLECPHCGESIDLFKTGGGEAAANEMGVNFLGRIPIDPHMVKMGDLGQPYVVQEPNEPAPRAFHEIAHNLEKRVSEEGGK
ncbi:MAG: Mrp/NBP35 family ATP-binding protein [Thermoplasmata archaeon]|nr:MAG: Mrp/NBP35 family ATP-binding protein [Thermoplasmata archaeon]